MVPKQVRKRHGINFGIIYNGVLGNMDLAMKNYRYLINISNIYKLLHLHRKDSIFQDCAITLLK